MPVALCIRSVISVTTLQAWDKSIGFTRGNHASGDSPPWLLEFHTRNCNCEGAVLDLEHQIFTSENDGGLRPITSLSVGLIGFRFMKFINGQWVGPIPNLLTSAIMTAVSAPAKAIAGSSMIPHVEPLRRRFSIQPAASNHTG